jgi:hypothetical protein
MIHNKGTLTVGENILLMYLHAPLDTLGHADIRGRLPPHCHWLGLVTYLEPNEECLGATMAFSVNEALCPKH